jgi:hypothetical protein
VSYTIENALFQWEEGEARVRASEGRELDQAARLVVDQLRRRLGGSFTLDELVALYAEGTDWVSDEVQRSFWDVETSAAVNAGFIRYARSASDYAGGRRRILEDSE